jgi:radical SAM superfamily enzyme YgiQ (UPF0313 family)
MERYFEAAALDTTVRGGHGRRWAPILTSRGCPYRCNFCSVHLLEGRKWRGRPPQHIVAEMEQLHENYGISVFTIEDSNFTFDIKRAVQICELIAQRLPEATFSLPNGIRADRIPQELVDALARANCSEVTVAIEHGDQEFLDSVIKKRLKLKGVVESVRRVRRKGIPVSGFFILGIPPETKQTLWATWKMALKLAKIGMLPQLNIAMPMPGTEMYEHALTNGFIAHPLQATDYLVIAEMRPLIDGPTLSGHSLLRAKTGIYLTALITAFVFNPKYFFTFPFIRSTLRDFSSFRTFKRRLRKILGLLGFSRASLERRAEATPEKSDKAAT